MEKYTITAENFQAFEHQLRLEERSAATIQKYMRNLHLFFDGLREITREDILERKESILQGRAIQTVNGVLTAVNRFFDSWDMLICG